MPNTTKLTDSIRNHIIKDVPLQDFFDLYVPETTVRKKKPVTDFSRLITKRTRKGENPICIKDLQAKLVSLISSQRLCPNFKFTVTTRHGATQRIACYPQRTRINDSVDAWEALQFTMSVSATDVLDDEDSMRCEASCVHEQFSRQHRTFIFSLWIFGRLIRFLYWDHSGVIVTEPVDYIRNPDSLAEFLWRYSHLELEARGFDVNVVAASYAESCLLTNAIRTYFGKVKAGRLHLISHAQYALDKTFPVYKVCVHELELVIRRPFFQKNMIVGTSTRGYMAYLLGERRLVFLKDFWEPVKLQEVSEVEMYQYLDPLGVPHMPKNLSVGNVPSSIGSPQHTRSQDLTKKWFPSAHARIVQEIIYPLDLARNSKELVQAIRDSLEAIDEAYRKGNVLHGDISRGNVMISAHGRGILNDWDSSLFSGSRRWRRTGTWFYMSCEKLQDIQNLYQHCVKDDIESAFWLLYAQTLRFFLPQDPKWEMHWNMYYEEKVSSNNPKKAGGFQKQKFLMRKAGKLSNVDVLTPCIPLRELLQEFRDLLGRYYLARNLQKSVHYAKLSEEEKESARQSVEALSDARAAIKLFDHALSRHNWLEDDALQCQVQEKAEDEKVPSLTSCFGVPHGARTEKILELIDSDPEIDSIPNCIVPAVDDSKTASNVDVRSSVPLRRRGLRMVVGNTVETTEPVDYRQPPGFVGKNPKTRSRKRRKGSRDLEDGGEESRLYKRTKDSSLNCRD